MNIYLDKGRSWKRDKVTYKMARTKDKKVKVNSSIEELWYKLIELLEKNPDYFYTESDE
jgi:transcription elongation factor GreA-like protein